MRLSKPQMLVYNMEKYTGGTVSILCGSILLDKKYDYEVLNNAINRIIEMNPMLRVRIDESDGVPTQHITDYVKTNIEKTSFKNEKELNDYGKKMADKALDFYGCLFEVLVADLPEASAILLKLHHIIGDAWTMMLIANQTDRLIHGEPVNAGNYNDYLVKEEDYLQSKRYDRDKCFYTDMYEKCNEPTLLARKRINDKRADNSSLLISAADSKRIRSFCNKYNISPFAFFTAIIATYISRLLNCLDNVYIGVAILNRDEDDLNTVGMFVNTVPILAEMEMNSGFAENAMNIQYSLMKSMRHQRFNYLDLLKELRTSQDFQDQLYDVVVSYQNVSSESNHFSCNWYNPKTQDESIQFHIDDRDNDGRFHIEIDYLIQLFSETLISRMKAHLENMIKCTIFNDQLPLRDIVFIAETERNLLFNSFNRTYMKTPHNSVFEMFEHQVSINPKKTAVIATDTTLTYKELNEQANRIANNLIDKGIVTGDIVPVNLRRKSYVVSALMGILKAGAAYYPIDPSYPQERIDFMIKDCNAKIVVDENNIMELLSGKNSADPHIHVEQDDICFCVCTSGSTGNPKLALLKHRGLSNFCHYWRNEPGDTFVSLTTISFDAFTHEIMVSLTSGMKIVLASEEDLYDQEKFEALFDYSESNTVFCTPTKLRNYINNSATKAFLAKIKVFYIGGESFPADFYNIIRKYSDGTIYNGYGPSETTIGVTFHAVENKDDISIGGPIANTQIYIVDRYMNVMPVGFPGEVCIAGFGVGAGYHNRPVLTSEKFVVNPFGEGTLYKTGDLAYWRDDGNICFIGRNDYQVKIRGIRIELEEIERSVCSIDGITQAAVLVRKNSEGRQILCCFYSGEEIGIKIIKNYLSKKLPQYMIPHIITYIKSMPITSSGKINRKRLPDIDINSYFASSEYVAPRTEIEGELCETLKQVLHSDKISIDDDFFDVGVDSLKAIEFIAKAKSRNIDVPLQFVFDYPTIRRLADVLNKPTQQGALYDRDSFKKYEAILKRNTSDECVSTVDRELGYVVLTGATGFLGAHLLKEIIGEGAKKVYCLVRSKEKLCRALTYYFGQEYLSNVRKKIIAIEDDITNENISDILPSKVDTIIHAAACVKHYGDYSFFKKVNVDGTRSMVEYAKHEKARFVYISTLSISGNSFADDISLTDNNTDIMFSEQCLYEGQALDNVYVRSKFEAETVVLDGILEGLDAKIMRVGFLANRNNDYKFQPNYTENAFLKRFKAFVELGCIPDYLCDLQIEFSPVDDTAKAIVMLSRHMGKEYSVFHLNSDKGVTFTDIVHWLNMSGYRFDIVSNDDFQPILLSTLFSQANEYIYESLQNDISHSGKIKYDSNIHIDSTFTMSVLDKLGFSWSVIGYEYINAYLQYFIDLGYISPKPKMGDIK